MINRCMRQLCVAIVAVVGVLYVARTLTIEAPLARFGGHRGRLMLRDGDSVKRFGRRIIHQSWRSEQVPAKLVNLSRTWQSHHRDALHVLWTDEDNAELVRRFYPEYEDMYKNLALDIMRADVVRLMYVHQYGGIYADMDYEARANLFAALPGNDDV